MPNATTKSSVSSTPCTPTHDSPSTSMLSPFLTLLAITPALRGAFAVVLATGVAAAQPNSTTGGRAGARPGPDTAETAALAAPDSTRKAEGKVDSKAAAGATGGDTKKAPSKNPSKSPPSPTRTKSGSARPAAAPSAAAAAAAAAARRDSALNAMWPVKGPPPLPGAILPHKRIIAFYGNPLSTRMGVLGEYEPDEMLRRLDAEVAAWEKADPSTPVQPALHLIAVVAQAHPGRDGKYRLRMDSTLIERVATWAKRRDALVFLDLQVGHSTLPEELPRLAGFLSRPNFHLGIDPEFSMKNGGLPGKRIGTFDATDINYASAFLADLVARNNIPPKVLVIHRFTRRGVTNYQDIRLDSRVQVVMHMDGFGSPTLKKTTFRSYIKAEPVQFVGWKQFFKAKNDNPRTTIAEILKLWPVPLYVQYQ